MNDEVIDYAKKISGFKSVNLFIRDFNFGFVDNFYKAIERVFEEYDRVIVSEDDNVFSEDFLAFINKGLNFYEDNSKVFSVCAYNYPIDSSSDACDEGFYFSKFFSAWGFGVWKNRWEEIEWSKEVILDKTRDFLKNYKNVYKYNKTANNLVLNLIYMIKNNTIYGDSYISLHQYLSDKYSVFPVIARVRNIGHDGSGIHCKNKKKNRIYTNQILYTGDSNYNLPAEIKEDDNINKLLKQYLRRGVLKNIYTFLMLLLLNIGFYKKNKS